MLMVKQKKRDGTIKYRFVIDMRKLNEITVKDAYPLPRIDQTLDAIGNSAFLTVMDAARGYFQVNLKETDREKTAFVAYNELYKLKRMASGLTNAPSTYSRLLQCSQLLYDRSNLWTVLNCTLVLNSDDYYNFEIRE